MRLLLLLLLCQAALASPLVTRVAGNFQSGSDIPIRGHYFQGQARFTLAQDLRDCRQIRAHLQLKNTSRNSATFSVYLVLLDKGGHILGAEGREESAFSREPGWQLDHEIDLAMPHSASAAAAVYHFVLYEEK